MKSVHILVAEDDRSVAEGLRDIFRMQGYAVSLAANGKEAMAVLNSGSVDLAVLDVGLGSEDGCDLCREIRGTYDLPILFLTAHSSELELVRGFRSGGDDYLTKPFRMQELLLRVEALLRRCARTEERPLRTGSIELDSKKQLAKRDGITLSLSGVELRIVSHLTACWPRTVTRDELLYHVWDRDADFVDANTLNVNISRLREKLGSSDGQSYIETVRGVGYRWAVPVER